MPLACRSISGVQDASVLGKNSRIQSSAMFISNVDGGMTPEGAVLQGAECAMHCCNKRIIQAEVSLEEATGHYATSMACLDALSENRLQVVLDLRHSHAIQRCGVHHAR
jgi:hypothetical protein